MNIRFEIMTVTHDAKIANIIADKLLDYLEHTLDYDAAIVVIDADTEVEL